MNRKLLKGITELYACIIGAAPSAPAPFPCDQAYTDVIITEERRLQLLSNEYASRSGDALPLFSVFVTAGEKKQVDLTLDSLRKQTTDHHIAYVFDSNATKTYSSERKQPYGMALVLRAGVMLKPYALSILSLFIKQLGMQELIYADSETVTSNGTAPVIKPDNARETALCSNVFTDMICLSSRLFDRLGGIEALSANSRAFTIRAFQNANSILHIPHTLSSIEYHSPEVTSAAELESINGAFPHGRTALLNGAYKGSLQFRCRIGVRKRVDIIIPADVPCDMLRNCLEAIDELTTFDRYRLIITASENADDKLHDYLNALAGNHAAEIIKAKGIACRPELLNLGAQASNAEKLIFIAPEATVCTPDYVERLLEPLFLSGVAACGGKLKYADGRLYHTGTVIGLNGWIGSLYRGEYDDCADELKCFYSAMQRNVSAVDGRFMAVDADAFHKAGGFDATLNKLLWDAALCIRLRELGKRCVYTPYAEAKLSAAPLEVSSLDRNEQERCYELLRNELKHGDLFYSTRYDYSSSIPKVSSERKPPIELNSFYN